jgi:flagellar hook-basal body complex protein FliE
MKDVNDLQNKADTSIEKMAAGEITDVHQVLNSVQEANLAFNMMMEIRNKVMDAYQEIMRLRL